MTRIGTRWLGVGLTSAVAALTIVLAATGQLALFINPAQTPFAVGMAVLVLVGAVCSFALPLGAEDDHGHADGHDHAGSVRAGARVAALAGGAVASVVVGASILLPPQSLSVELAMERDTGTPPLFAGADEVTFAASVDTDSFGVGGWAAAFARSTDPDTFDGSPVTLTGFVTPGDDGIRLGRLVITHCVIDAQPAYVPVSTDETFETGQWVELSGSVTATSDGALTVTADDITPVAEPDDPYEY
ncbi:MAG: TIGR03943 family putative permease subunit [Microbacterium sp.]